MEEGNLGNLENKSTWGGARPNSGRPAGGKNKATLEKKVVEEEMRQRVLNNAQRILDAQFNLAQGCSYLYRIEKDEKGKNKKPELVVDPETIAEYLDGEFGDGESMNDSTVYYYITAEKPSSFAIDSLLDRTFGKPKQPLVGGDEGDNPILVKPIYGGVSKYNSNQEDIPTDQENKSG